MMTINAIDFENCFEIPLLIQRFIDSKISCSQVSLLPCVYDDFKKMQMGYRWNPVMKCSLISNEFGKWKNSWYVIAQNGMGDPFFVDIDEAEYPVYTAVHGTGKWSAIKVSDSIQQFSEILNKINEIEPNFPCGLEALAEVIDLENEFWQEVNASCHENE